MARRGEQGYVLVATLVVLAVTSLVAASAAIRMQALSDRVAAARQRAYAEQAITSEMARQLFMLSTTARAPCGLTPDAALSTDPFSTFARGAACEPVTGQWQGQDGLMVSVTDRTGLLSVNTAAGSALTALHLELEDGQANARAAIQALRDYIDGDEVAGEFGAERRAYFTEGRPQPRNAPMLTPYEIVNVRGWERMASPDRLTRLDATFSPAIAVNAAPPSVLRYTLGVNAEEARLIRARAGREGGITSLDDINQTVGRNVQVSPTALRFVAPEQYRIRLAAPGAPVREIAMTRQTEAAERPWRVDYSLAAPSSLAPRQVRGGEE